MNGRRQSLNPLILHGPPGSGKSHLATSLLTAVARADRTARSVMAADLIFPADSAADNADLLQGARACDLVIVEDLQFLPPHAANQLSQLLDYRTPRGLQTVFTANVGPSLLSELPARLTSRLMGGLVVGIMPLSLPSRRTILQKLIASRELRITDEALNWVAEITTGGVRSLRGAVQLLGELAKSAPFGLNLDTVQSQWPELIPNIVSLDQIAGCVASWYRLQPRDLRGRVRQPSHLRPAQVAIALARELTPLAPSAIGNYFGGRDPDTVLHACRRVIDVADPATDSAMRHLRAELAAGGKSR